MKRIETDLKDVVLIEMDEFRDARGFFMESFHQEKFKSLGIDARFVQDNHSGSMRGTLRGLHFQLPHAQGKLVRAIAGAVYDAAVDIRVGSPTFGKFFGTILSSENRLQIYIPEGFAHGFCVLSDFAELQYKCTDFYAPECERGIAWNDPDLGIDWPIADPMLSKKDTEHLRLKDIPTSLLPKWNGDRS
jgi:dTDP-4-dehydrorhamnose 3,5-epimerase